MENTNTAVAEAPLESVEELQQQLNEEMEPDAMPEVMEITMEPVEEVMILPENVNPNLVDELAAIDPEEHDIAEEIGQMDTFQEYQREIFAEMRGMTSDHF
jgi:hypothetical protein